jgi:hypothetical protein
MDYKTIHTLTGALISFQEFMQTNHGISDISEVDRSDPALLASAESWARGNEDFQELLFK